jgi:predicted dinucleotide-binding enzyme
MHHIASRREVLVRLGAAAAFGMLWSPAAAFAQAQPAPANIKIGIVGSGRIGSTVGGLWVKSGHPVMFSSRHPEELQELVRGLGSLAKAGTVQEAIAFGDVVFMAVPYGAYPQIGKDHGPQLAGKVVLDAGNAVERRDGEITKETQQEGIGLTSAKYFPGAHIVRALNTLGYGILAKEANRAGERLAIPIAGDDQEAVRVATSLIADAGFEAVLVGPLARAKEFAQGGPLYGQQMTAREMRQRLGADK